MEFKEADLPGIGKKYTINLSEGGELVVIVCNTGKREIYVVEEEDESPKCIITLNEEEAKQLGFLLAGAKFQSVETDKMEFLTKQIVMEWVKVGGNSPFVGKSIAELEIRKKTGVSIVAIIRDDNVIPAPDPDEKIKEGDTLVVVGTREKISNFLKYCQDYSL